LLTPPETPLFPSLDGSESQPTLAAARSSALNRSTSSAKPSRVLCIIISVFDLWHLSSSYHKLYLLCFDS
ncbi:hypothetical protein ABKV19_006038, partial [Rosa sericea]